MLKLLRHIALLIAAITLGATISHAQSTTVSATVTDPSGNIYANGTYNISFIPGSGTSLSTLGNGGPRFQQSYTGTLTAAGALSVPLPSNTTIVPASSQWDFYICDITRTYCFHTGGVTITGTTQDISATIKAAATNIGGTLTPTFVTLVNQTPAPGTPAAGRVSLYTKVSDKLLYYKDDTGTERGPLTTAAAAGVTGSGTTGYFSAFTGAAAIGNSVCDYGITHASSMTCATNSYYMGVSGSTYLVGPPNTGTLTIQTLDAGGTLNLGDANQLSIITGTTGYKVGGGVTIKKVIGATATLDFGNLAALGCEDLTITVTGAVDGDSVVVAAPVAAYVSQTSTYTGFVSAADTVKIRYCALVSGDPPSSTFRATVTQY